MYTAEPRIEVLEKKSLVGMHQPMSFLADTTGQLWSQFMARYREIQNRYSEDFISMQVYPADFNIENFAPNASFEKWAVVEVAQADQLPAGMERYDLAGGSYAVFSYTGSASGAPQVFGYIFTRWLPQSKYVLDEREHFEMLLANYDPLNDESQEEIWIPVKKK